MATFTANATTNLLTFTLGVGEAALAPGVPYALTPGVVDGDALPDPLQPSDGGARYYLRDVDAGAGTAKLAYYPGLPDETAAVGPAIDILDAGTGIHTAVQSKPVSALDYAYEGCRTYFAERGRLDVLAWGPAEVTKQNNQGGGRASRVVFVPGDDAGKMGKIGPAKNAGRQPREILSFQELASVHIWGRDPSAARGDHRAHYRVAYDLFELVLCGMREALGGGDRFGAADPMITQEPNENVFGVELVVAIFALGRIVEAHPAVIRPTGDPVITETFEA